MPLIREYMEMSLDGYIANINGGLGFLGRYDVVDSAFDFFFRTVGTCVLGRTAYDAGVALFRDVRPFADKRVIVVTSRPLDAPHWVEIWNGGVGPELVSHLRAAIDGDVWVVGGGKLQSALLAMDAIDRMEICLIPVLLGDGIPMFPKTPANERWFKLADIRAVAQGGVILDYRRLPSA